MSLSNVPPTRLSSPRVISNRSCSRVYHRAVLCPGCTIWGSVRALEPPGKPLAPARQRPLAPLWPSARFRVARDKRRSPRVRDARGLLAPARQPRARAAEEVLVAPLVTVGVTGVRTTVTFFKDALERLGIGAEVVAVSPYKSAGEPYTRNDFSPEAREQAGRLLDGRYEELVRAICEARGLTEEQARGAIDAAPYGHAQALAARLVDGVLYEDGLPQRLGAVG